MRYLSPPSTPKVRDAMKAGRLGAITTPKQGNILPAGVPYACDNGKFGKGWPGEAKWFAWLGKTVQRYGRDLCLFAVAPDVPFDAMGTYALSALWLAPIRALGVPVAFCAQDGAEAPGLVPWDHIDVLFLAGTTEWKLSQAAADLAAEAKRHGKGVHMGRVNSEERFRHAIAIDCDSADGTFIVFGPDVNLARLQSWQDRLPKRQPPHVQFDLLGLLPGGAA